MVDIVLKNNAVIHTSHITNICAMTYQNRKYGLVFQLNEENLWFMTDEDSMTVDALILLENSDFPVDKHYFLKVIIL